MEVRILLVVVAAVETAIIILAPIVWDWFKER
jgi:hypothetical protein